MANINPKTSKTIPEEKGCKGCSPFFSCGSCVGFIAGKQLVITLEVMIEKPTRDYAPYQQSAFQQVALSIWQPPKLS